ncbi:hypothetical protein EHQ12_02370 [Leptospira gomenensis]|uniref:Galactose oxidase n=1 Tax=Leptospira gomenensis TaxID=2484974 RepID=A0A5F1YLZ9_9LEPT|nr:hypothetical protein [Leptospira gomenensis]TGK33721.1 hypothetical protein EHQ17_10475 [Leptospira gomenensis]TGK41964.1 hypothetical protein EHQ07_15115 [Leptospira gomenensis]TGK44214.1 hypothetical protein EHQ12_02370 [Leptospira gomenensis]TGK58002.1 hypothetical protein EHQ13_14655 [Leptospira gomenensis]
MKKGTLFFFLTVFLSCAEASKFSLDTSNPLAVLGQFGWSYLGLVPSPSLTRFVAVGEVCSSWISRDALSWTFSKTRFPGCIDGAIQEVVYDGVGTWVAVGSTNANGSCGIWYSSDEGESWNQANCDPLILWNGAPVTKPLFGVTYGGGRFWAVGPHNGASTNEEFFGQYSSDGIHWTSIAIEDGSTYDGADYYDSVSYDPVHGKVYFGGQHQVNSEVGELDSSTLQSNSVSVGMPSFINRVLALGSGQLLVYGSDNYLAPTLGKVKMGSSLTSLSSSMDTAVAGPIQSAVEGSDKIVILGDQCSIDYFEFSAGVWHPTGASPPPEMSQCSRLNWMSSAYNSVLGLFVAGAKVTGSVPTAFAYSATGIPSDWTVVAQPDAGTPGPGILGIATH